MKKICFTNMKLLFVFAIERIFMLNPSHRLLERDEGMELALNLQQNKKFCLSHFKVIVRAHLSESSFGTRVITNRSDLYVISSDAEVVSIDKPILYGESLGVTLVHASYRNLIQYPPRKRGTNGVGNSESFSTPGKILNPIRIIIHP